jgi:hypothetical protein
MNHEETIGWMGVTFGAFLAFIIVSKLTFGIVSAGSGPAQPEAALYLVVAIGCYAVGSGLVLRAHDDDPGGLRETAGRLVRSESIERRG